MEVKPLEVNYLRVGKDVYALTPMPKDMSIDVKAELQEFHEKRLKAYVAESNRAVSGSIESEWETEVRRLREKEDSTSITVPERLFDKPVVVIHRKLCEVRTIAYAPQVVVGSMDLLRHNYAFTQEDLDSLRGGADIGQVTTITIELKMCPFVYPILIAYSKKDNMLYCVNGFTYHTMSDRHICTGSNEASRYANLSHERFSAEMNTINLFSLATPDANYKGHHCGIRELVNRDNVQSIKKRSDDVWSGQQTRT